MSIFKTAIFGYLFCAASIAWAQEPVETTNSAAEPVASTLQTRQAAGVSEMLNYALNLIGVNYKYGGAQPTTGFDCSGYVSHVFRQVAGLSLPHNALAISRQGKQISMKELQPGDLVFFNTLRRSFSHVGIYIGNNRFVHAPSSGGGVEVVSLQDSYWVKHFNGARRILTFQPPAGLASE
ncbi:peptidase P60 [Sulfurimicrobium lacus]|uniref:Peptidase P60 n=1 Tax=Sulfurimicrobium lacus TaxID=2715678 RepID=A0A6F8VDC3_9PROT|nr:C40 family peptidase [Sulfurimicrobium lacus]BCB27151.1 peptidase P60 [Sulfurimicrobium lacus]